MNPRKPSRRQIDQICGQVGPEDGIDPRELARLYRLKKPGGRKTSQLCHQVAVALEELLAEQPDDLLRDLTVVEVEPAPDESHLLVTVGPNAVARPTDPLAVIQRLGEATKALRAELAATITRKRTPALDFRYAPSGLPL